MRGIEFAGAGLAGEGDQMLGNYAGGDDFRDSAFLQAWPRVAPESPAVVGQHAKLPAHFDQHGEAALQVRNRELAGPWRELATMRVGAMDLVIVAAEQPLRIIGIFEAGPPKGDRLFVGQLEDGVRVTVRILTEPALALQAIPRPVAA